MPMEAITVDEAHNGAAGTPAALGIPVQPAGGRCNLVLAATAPAPSRLQAAVNDAAKLLYDAEAALHIARQTGVGSWISAAYDRLHEAVAGHTAAVTALQGGHQPVPSPRRACGGPPSTTAFRADAGQPDQCAAITVTTSEVAERRPR